MISDYTGGSPVKETQGVVWNYEYLHILHEDIWRDHFLAKFQIMIDSIISNKCLFVFQIIIWSSVICYNQVQAIDYWSQQWFFL